MNNLQLKNYQDEKVKELVGKCHSQLDKAEKNNETRSCLLEAPTGSGKTVMMGEFIKRFIDPKFGKQIAFLWLAPNKLQQQSYEKLKNQLSGTGITCITPEQIKNNSKIEENHILFLNWASINRENNLLRISNERDIFLDSIARNTRARYKIVSIIDEGHNTAGGVKTQKPREIINSHLEIFVTATAGQLRNQCHDLVTVDPDDPVNEGMICESVKFNSSEQIQQTSSMEKKDVIKFGLDERKRLADLFQDEKIDGKSQINPLMLIQLKSKSAAENDDERDEVERILASHGITYENGKLAVYLSDDHLESNQSAKIIKRNKKNLDDKTGLPKGKKIDDNDSTVEVLIFKQAIALGWDCPRASILCLFRDLKDVEFGIQVIGRLMRMPDQKHYEKNLDLNHAYVIANFDRIKLSDDIKKLVEQDYQNRKENLWSKHKISLTRFYKKKISSNTNLVTSKFVPIFLGPTIQKKFKELYKYKVDKLKPHTQKVLQNLEISVEGFYRLTNEIVGFSRDLQDGYEQRKQEYAKRIIDYALGFELNDSKDAIESSLYKSFEKNPFNFKPFENKTGDEDKIRKYVTSPDTESILEECFEIAKKIYKEKYVPKSNFEIEKGADWEIPKRVSHLPNANLIDDQKYIIEKLDDSRLASLPEKKFAEALTSSKKVTWWYKNGDYGRDNFAIPYQHGGKIHEFFIDFIVCFTDGKIGLFDTKSGQTLTSDETKDKAEYLSDYIKNENKSRPNNQQLIGGIVTNLKMDQSGNFVFNSLGDRNLFVDITDNHNNKISLKWTDVPI
jgi:type III restriction enzyme